MKNTHCCPSCQHNLSIAPETGEDSWCQCPHCGLFFTPKALPKVSPVTAKQLQPVSLPEDKPVLGGAIEDKASSAPAKKQEQEALQALLGCLALIFIGFFVWLTFYFLFSDGGAPSGPAIAVSASELYAAFEDHEIKADDTYKNKKVRVSGIVQSIESGGLLSSEYVILSNGNPFNPFGIGCYWESKHKDQLRRIAKGQIVIIEGICMGRTLGIVGIHESRLVE